MNDVQKLRASRLGGSFTSHHVAVAPEITAQEWSMQASGPLQ